MRSTLLLLLLIPAALGAGFVAGRETAEDAPPPPAPSRDALVVRAGDVVRAPAAATRCEGSQEGGTPNLFCTRIPRGRHQVVFTADTVFVFEIGNPDTPAYEARWRP